MYDVTGAIIRAVLLGCITATLVLVDIWMAESTWKLTRRVKKQVEKDWLRLLVSFALHSGVLMLVVLSLELLAVVAVTILD